MLVVVVSTSPIDFTARYLCLDETLAHLPGSCYITKVGENLPYR